MRRRLAVHSATAVWMVFTTASLLLPANPDLGDHFRWLPVPVDKAAHFVLFLVSALVLHRSFALELRRGGLAAAAALAVGYGLLTELVQGLLPVRGADTADALANTLGVAVYVGWALAVGRRGPRPGDEDERPR